MYMGEQIELLSITNPLGMCSDVTVQCKSMVYNGVFARGDLNLTMGHCNGPLSLACFRICTEWPI